MIKQIDPDIENRNMGGIIYMFKSKYMQKRSFQVQKNLKYKSDYFFILSTTSRPWTFIF